MSAFTDREGRTWKLALTVGVLADVRRDAGVDLGKAIRGTEGLADLLFSDPETFVRVLWVLIEAQAQQQEVSPEQFGHGFDGPSLEAAGEAFMEAVADFFPRSKVGKALKGRLTRGMEAMDQAILAKLEEDQTPVTLPASKNSAGGSPVSPGSTPDP